MTDQESPQSVLKRLLRTAGTTARTEAAMSPARSVRLSLARSAERSVGLTLSVSDVSEGVHLLDDTLTQIDPAMMLVGLGPRGALTGFAALDLQLRTILVEVQTLGTQRDDLAAERGISASDAALAAPFLDAFLHDVFVTSDDAELEIWSNNVVADRRIESVRAARMLLANRPMRQILLKVAMGQKGREGRLLMVLPDPTYNAAPKPDDATEFTTQMQRAVFDAPTTLHASLPSVDMPLSAVQAFSTGQLVPLPGVTVGAVILTGPDGATVATARLGQAAGQRAVRIETPAAREMRDTPRAKPDAEATAGALTHGGQVGDISPPEAVSDISVDQSGVIEAEPALGD